jgi:hypothetical protein
VVEASCRASLVRVGTWSRRSVRGFGLSRLRGRSPWRGFLRGLSFLIVDCGYPLFRYPTPATDRWRKLVGARKAVRGSSTAGAIGPRFWPGLAAQKPCFLPRKADSA